MVKYDQRGDFIPAFDEDISRLFERVCVEGQSAMPELYALTAPKIYGIVHRLVADEAVSSRLVLKVYQHIWQHRHERSKRLTMTDLIALAQRFALDYKAAGGAISRIGRETDRPLNGRHHDLSDLSATDLETLGEIHVQRQLGGRPAPVEPVSPQDLRQRLANMVGKGGGA